MNRISHQSRAQVRLEDIAEWIELFENSSAIFRIYAGSVWTFAAIIGLLCVLTRWAMDRGTTRP